MRSPLVPLTGPEAFRQRSAAIRHPDELHATRDERRLWIADYLASGAVLHLGVATQAAMLQLNLTSSRGCHPGDIAERTDSASMWLCVSNRGGLLTDWRELSGGGGGSLPALTGQAGKYLRVNATEDGVEWATPSGGGDLALLASDDMTAMTNWTTVAGTWATGGGGTYIEQTSATIAYQFLRFNPVLAQATLIEVEVYFPSSASTILFGAPCARWNGTETSFGSQLMGGPSRTTNSGAGNRLLAARSNAEDYSLTGLTIATDTWHKVSVLFGANWVSIVVGGDQCRAYLAAATGVRDRVGLSAIGNVRFRNFRAYGPAAP